MNRYDREYVFLVKARIEVNGKELITTTWQSGENFDDCYRKMSNYIKKHTTEEDSIIKHILWTSQKDYPITVWGTFD